MTTEVLPQVHLDGLAKSQRRMPSRFRHLALASSLTIALTLMALLSRVPPAMAQVNTVAPGRMPTARSQPLGPTDTAELEAFLDELLFQQMEAHHIAGAAVSVVKDGKLLFAKGYGYADLENGVPVDAEATVFRIGSVGKLFTWTAVMQLVEQGKLDLDADINTYLDFQIPDTYPQPITLKHLMTHTSGFEDRLLDSLVSGRQRPHTCARVADLAHGGAGVPARCLCGLLELQRHAGRLHCGAGVRPAL